MTKIIGYARVSTTKQDLSRQKLKIKEFCENNNYELIEIIEDFGISGVVADRRGYLELQSRTYKDADMIVISELSRLSRQEDVTETVHNIQQIINKGLSVILLTHIAAASRNKFKRCYPISLFSRCSPNMPANMVNECIILLSILKYAHCGTPAGFSI